MKKIFATLLLLSALTVYAATGFCEGWSDGYKAGYCYQQYGCIPPIVPICPIPNIGEDSYQDGYNRGFLAGLNDR